MARCERGYLCTVCGEEVEGAGDSALYLRYLLGEVAPEELPNRPECHVRCDAELAQYVVDPDFPTVRCDGPFGKDGLDPGYVAEQEQRITAAWRRLQGLAASGLSLLAPPDEDTPLPGP